MITKLNNKAVANITTLPVALGDMVFISSQTASSSASISFTTGIDSTYKEYVFYFVNIHPASDSANFQFQTSTDGGSNYNTTVTSTCFLAQHSEDDSVANLGYYAARDQAQGTAFHDFMTDLGNGADESGSGTLTLFNPSSTTYVKHFIASALVYYEGNRFFDYEYAGYFNTTSAINAIQFKMSSGNIDSGKILMFGLN